MKTDWNEKTVKIGLLKPYEHNPRRISQEAYTRLRDKISRFGYHQRILVTPNMEVIGGHQRIRALKELGFKEVNVLMPSRDLTIDEFREILVADNLPFGEFDFDILSADFDHNELIEWGMDPKWLGDPIQKNEGEEKEGAQSVDGQELKPQTITCPSCDHKFSVLASRIEEIPQKKKASPYKKAMPKKHNNIKKR